MSFQSAESRKAKASILWSIVWGPGPLGCIWVPRLPSGFFWVKTVQVWKNCSSSLNCVPSFRGNCRDNCKIKLRGGWQKWVRQKFEQHSVVCANAVISGAQWQTLVPRVFQRLVTWHCQIRHGLMDGLVHTDSSRGPRAAGWGWWHRTPRRGSGLTKSKALYKVGWVSFSLFHRWEIKALERFPTCQVHKSLWNPPLTVPPAAPQRQKPCL